ncbi:MAG: ribose-phosphate diphosphokinase [Chloroflexota bacterium]
MSQALQVFSGTSNLALAQEICDFLQIPLGAAAIERFPNDELRLRIEQNVRGADVFVVQSMSEPVDQHIMQLLIMIDALRRGSADRITAVVPYFAYAKQEKKTAPREPISAKLVANLLTVAGADRVLTVDLHAAAIEGFFDIPVDHLRGAPILADYVRSLGLQNLVVVSPDAGGVARANDFRYRIGASLAIIAKQRLRPDAVEVIEMVGDVRGRTAVIVDDMISTGGTLLEAAHLLRERGAAAIYVVATHAILAGNAAERMRSGVLDRAIVTNTIAVPDSKRGEALTVLSVAPLLGETIRRIHENMSVSALFT